MRCFLLALVGLPWALGATIQGRLVQRVTRSDTRILLDNQPATWTTQEGAFKLHNVAPGNYVLSVDSKDYLYPQFAVSVLAGDQVFIRPYDVSRLPSDKAPVLPHPLTIHPFKDAEYVEAKQPFSLKGLVLGNPMILLMAGGAALMFLMPKLMESLDPEALKEMQENQAQMHKQMTNMDLAGGLSSLLAGPAAPAPAPGSSVARSKGDGSARKRK